MRNQTYTFFTDEKRDEFLQAVSDAGGNISEACRVTLVSRPQVYTQRKGDPEFAKALEEARELGVEALEDECRRRAYDGVDEPVIWQGKRALDDNGVPMSIKKYSDTLLMFLLKGAKPGKYRERYDHEVSGPGGGPVSSTGVVVYLPDNGRGSPDATDAD